MKMLHAVAKQRGLDHEQLRALAAETCGIESMTDMTRDYIDMVLERLEQIPVKDGA
jgi:hypothetical protein